MSRIAFEKERYEKAAELLEHSLKLEADQARVHFRLGRITEKFLNRPDEGLFHLRRAIELDPGLEMKLAPWISALEAGKTD